MKCDCGHSADHHNPGEDNNFSGNCRNCECSAFGVGADSRRPGVYSLIARQRGEVIVKRWNDEVEALKVEHANELAKRDVMLEEQKRLMRISNKRLVELESEIKELKKSVCSNCGETHLVSLRRCWKCEGLSDPSKHEESCRCTFCTEDIA